MAKKVLIIDDDVDFVEATKIFLEAKGFEVITSQNGKDGLNKMKNESPNLVLLDVMMTTRSEGFDVSNEISNNDKLKKIPVIMITGISREMDLSFGFNPDKDWLPV